MDSSIKLGERSLEEYVFGYTPQVPAWQLDLAAVFKEVIGKLKPQMKYLPCFKPMAELLNCDLAPAGAARKTDASLVKFPEGISERTKAMEVRVIEEGDVETISTRKSVILTEDGKILVWSAVYDRSVGNNKLAQWTRGRDEIARESRFEIFDEEKLRNAINQSHVWKCDWKKVVLRIFDCLVREMEKCTEERERYLASMRGSRNWLGGIVHRIQEPS